MECRRFSESLSLVHDHRLALGEDEELMTHLAECADCRATLDAYREISRQLRRLPRTLPNAAAEHQLFDAIRDQTAARPAGSRLSPRLTFLAAGVGSLALLALFGLMLLRVVLQIDETKVMAASTFVPPTPVPVVGAKQLYVVNQTNPGSISVIDSGTNTLVKRIDLSFRPGAPALDANAGRLYVAGGQGASAIIDTQTNEQIDWLMLRYPTWSLTLSVDGSHLYAAHPFENLVTITALPARTIIDEVRLDSRPYNVVASADGKAAYVTTSSGRVYRIDHAVRPAKVTPIFGADGPTRLLEQTRPAIALAPDGRTLYVAQLETGSVYALDLVDQTRRQRQIPFKAHARALAVSPDGDRVYVTYVGYSRYDTGGLLAFDARDLRQVSHLDTGPYLGVSVSPDSSTLYVTSQNRGTLSALDAKTLALIGVVDAGANPSGVVYKP